MNDNKLIIPISYSGHCSKAISAMLLKYPARDKPVWLQQTADEGNLHEDAIKAKLRSEGYSITDNREDCNICKERFGSGRKGIHVEYELGDILLIGHLDGLISNPDNLAEQRLLECKSMSQNEFYRWQRGEFKEFPHYAGQLSFYMLATGIHKALYLVKNRNLGNIERIEIPEQPIDFVTITNKMVEIEDKVKSNKLVDAEYDGNSKECQRCDYIGLCIPEVKEEDPATMEQLKHALNSRNQAKGIIKEENKVVRDSEDIIKNYLKKTKLKQRQFGYAMSLTIGRITTTYTKDSLTIAGVSEELIKKSANLSEPWDGLWIKNLNEED